MCVLFEFKADAMSQVCLNGDLDVFFDGKKGNTEITKVHGGNGDAV